MSASWPIWLGSSTTNPAGTYVAGTMSTGWDASINSNVLRQTYINGFLDVSATTTFRYDVSLNGNLFVASNKNVYINSDVSLGSRLFVTQDVSLNSRLFVTQDVSLNSRLFVAQDVSLNSRLFVAKDVSLNSRLFVSGDISLNGNLFIGGNINGNISFGNSLKMNGTTTFGSDASVNGRLFVLQDTSLNGNLFVAGKTIHNGDISLNGNLVVYGNLIVQEVTNANIINTTTTNYQLIISEDISLNGRLSVQKDASINGMTVGLGGGQLSSNTVVGLFTLSSNTTGQQNTAYGYNALHNNTTGSYNCAFGGSSLQNNISGTNNSAFGINALLYNTASYNTAYGSQALQQNISGSSNTAIGNQSLINNTTNSYNVAVGSSALSFTTGGSNTAVGYNAMIGVNGSSTGNNSAALGFQALQAITTGSSNVAVGYQTLYSNTTGSNNTAVGNQAGYAITTGSNNTVLGFNAYNTGATYTQSTAIGYNAQPTASNQVVLGTASETVICPNTLAIGKTSVTTGYTLDVNGIVNSRGTANTTAFQSSVNILAGSGVSSATYVDLFAGGSTSITSGSSYGGRIAGGIVQNVGPYLSFSSANSGGLTEVLRILNGYVGIGTASPSFLLDISGGAYNTVRSVNTTAFQAYCITPTSPGTSTSNYIDLFASPNTNAGQTLSSASTYGARISGGSSYGLGSFFAVGTSNSGTYTEGLRVQGISGVANVGINTTNPQYALDVSGQIRTNNTLTINSSTTNILPLSITSYGADTYSAAATSSSSRLAYSVPGMCVQCATYPNATNQSFLFDVTCYNSTNGACGVYFGGITTTGGANSAGQFVIGRRTGVTNWIESVRVDNNGYVGIGQTSPGYQLEVQNNVTSSNASISIFTSSNANSARYHAYNGNGTAEWIWGIPPSQNTYTISKLVSGTTFDYFTMLPSGYIGIGTTSPQFLLDVNGGVLNTRVAANTTAIQCAGNSGNVNIDLFNSLTNTLTTAYTLSSSVYGGRITGGNNLAPYPLLAFSLSNSGSIFEGMRLVQTSSLTGLGINTTNPTNFLHIVGNGSTSAIGAPDNGTNFNLLLQGTKTGSTPYSMALGIDYTTGYGFINCGGSSAVQPLLLNCRGGNVGIGLINPAYTLDVTGNIRATTGLALTGTGGLAVTSSGTSTINAITALTGTSGYVGIGTTSPGYLLDVNGTINSYVSNNITAFQAYANNGGASGFVNIDLFNNNSGSGQTISSAASYGSRISGGIISGQGGFVSFSTSRAGGTVSEGMRIQSNVSGNYVGIGTTTNYTYPLQVVGQIGAGSFNATSDYRIKTNIQPLDENFTLDNIKPVSFTNTLLKRQDIGMIAHEVEEHYPYLVTGEKDAEDYQTVNYTGFIGLLIHEVKQLKEQMKEMKAEIESLKAKQ